MSRRGMVIIGAGEAGCRAAFALRSNGYGGSITLIGDEAHIPYERPPLSKPCKGAVEPRSITTKESFDDAGVAYASSTRAFAINRSLRTVALCSGRVVAYDKLLLATGARARLIESVPAHARVLAVRTLEDARRFHENVRPGAKFVMIGAGFIGLELAAVARRSGAEVTVVEAQNRVLTRSAPESIAAILSARHAAEGVRMLTGARVLAVEPSESDVSVRLADQQTVTADVAVIGVGATPNVDLARACGLACGNGIEANENLRTTDQHIFAAGDCCSFPAASLGGKRIRLESWRNAQEQGEYAARSMLGGTEPFDAIPWFWSDQYDLGLQVVGLADLGCRSIERRGSMGELMVFCLAADGTLLSASGIAVGTAVARDIKIAESMIRGRLKPSPTDLANNAIQLKSILRSQA